MLKFGKEGEFCEDSTDRQDREASEAAPMEGNGLFDAINRRIKKRQIGLGI